MGKNHPYRDLIASVFPYGFNKFELRPSAGKGWGAFASVAISKDTTILSDPFMIVIDEDPERTESDVAKMVGGLDDKQKETFSRLRVNAERAKSATLLDTFNANSFCFPLADFPAQGVVAITARFNHSCDPNGKLDMALVQVPGADEPQACMVTAAVRDIAVGEEITISYGTDFFLRTASERQASLSFACDCRVCVPGPVREEEDARRAYARRHRFLMTGNDIPGSPPGFHIEHVHPIWRERAINRTTPHCAQLTFELIGNLAILKALGELTPNNMGLIKNLVVNLLNEAMSTLQAPDHLGVIRYALMQTTVANMVGVALLLQNRNDPADGVVPIKDAAKDAFIKGVSFWGIRHRHR
ncbi:hypothetical protein OQA88_5857 [Cercophora sp. LCS_1]